MNNFSILSLIKLALRHFTEIFITMLIFGFAAFLMCTYVITPKYSATGSVLVTNGAITSNGELNGNQSVKSTDVAASLSLVDTITDILKTNDIYKDLSNAITNKYSYTQLKNSTKISRRNDVTMFVDVTITTSNKSDSVKILNSYLDLAPAYISKFIPSSNATVTTTADTAQKTYPNTVTFSGLAALLGAALALLIVYIVSLLNNTVEDESDFNNHYENITVLGTIPDFASAKLQKNHKYY